MKKYLNYLPLLLILATTQAMSAQAGVQPRNGDFFINYTDIIVPDGDAEPLSLERTYNSRSQEHGWFGLGWGTPFETSLKTDRNGSIIVKENGSGAHTRFDKVDRKLAPLAINVKSGDELYYSGRWADEWLVRSTGGYVRYDAYGKKEGFDTKGRLVSLTSAKIDWRIKRDKAGLPKQIVSNKGAVINFAMNDNGTVARIWGVYGGRCREATYSYRGDLLLQSMDVDGNRYLFGYDKVGNMTVIQYSDRKQMHIEYDAYQYVRKVEKRDGRKVFYEYGHNDPKHPEQYDYAIVILQGADGVETKRQRIDF